MILYDLKLSLKNTRRKGKTSVLALITIGIASFVVVLLGGLYNYLFKSVEDSVIKENGVIWIEKGKDCCNFFTSDLENRFSEIDEIESYTYRGKISGVVGFQDKSSIFSGIVFDKKHEEVFSGSTGVKIGTLLAKNLGAGLNDNIDGFTGNGSFSSCIDEIVTTESEDKDLYYLQITFEDLGGLDYELIDSLYFKTSKKKFNVLLEKLKKILPANDLYIYKTYLDNDGYVKSVRAIYENNLAFIMVVLGITIFVMTSVLYLLLLYNRRLEIGVMRALGLKKFEIIFQSLFETGFITIYGTLLGAILSFIIGSLINALGGLKIPPPPTVETSIVLEFSFNFKYLLFALIELLSVSVISTLFVTNKILKETIVQELEEK